MPDPITGQTTSQEIARKRVLAQMLAEKSYGSPRNTNPVLGSLVELIGGIKAKKLRNKADAEQEEFNQARQGELAKLISAFRGTPETSTPIQGPTRPGDEPLGNDVQPAVAGGREALLKAMLGSTQSDIQTAGLSEIIKQPKQTMPTNFQRDLVAAGIDPGGPEGVQLLRNRFDKKSGVNINLGQEDDPMAPWKNINDPKKRDEAKIKYGTAAEKQLEKEREAVDQGLNVNQSIDRFLQLN